MEKADDVPAFFLPFFFPDGDGGTPFFLPFSLSPPFFLLPLAGRD